VVLVILCLFLHQTATGGEMNSYTFLLHHEVFTRAGQYLEALRSGEKPGAFLAANLAQTDLVQLQRRIYRKIASDEKADDFCRKRG